MYYMPSNPQCTFSPTALAHYLHYKITTTHLKNISITTSNGSTLHFPSIPCHSSSQPLDYQEFFVVRPKHCSPITHPNPTVNSATSETPMTRLLAHQRLCHNSDEVLDTMCWHQSLLGLPKHPFPPRTCVRQNSVISILLYNKSILQYYRPIIPYYRWNLR
jgi:hypothetical protein